MIRSLAFIFCWMLVFVSNASAKSPNVLLLFADDQCFETIRALGHTDIDTPNLDRLVSRGTTFTHCYNMGSWSGAVCVASRTMLITGRSVWHANKIYAKTDEERKAGRLWPQLMSKAGYRTCFTGKWHIQTDATKVFDAAKNVRGGMPKDTPEAYNRPLPGQPDPWSPTDPKFGGFWEGGKHWSEVVADDAIGYIQDSRDETKPFFIYAAFNAPHDPRQSPQAFQDRYPLSRISIPQNFLPEYPYKDLIGCSHSLRDEKLGPMPRTEQAVRVHRREYYALITHLDEQIGRIIEALEKSGHSDNTWIFFTADHGLALGHHGLFGKQNMYDHSVRVPFIVVGPQAKPNQRNATPIYLQDAMATSLDIAGIPRPEQVEFQSLLPLLRGETPSDVRDSIYGGYLELQRAITHDGWKLIAYPKAKTIRLYHVADDQAEMHDLADNVQHASIKAELFQRLLAMQQKLDDELDLSKVFPELVRAK